MDKIYANVPFGIGDLKELRPGTTPSARLGIHWQAQQRRNVEE